MRVLILGDLSSYHIYLFAETLSELGHEVHVASLEPPIARSQRFKMHLLKPIIGKRNFTRYIPAILPVRRLFEDISPDMVSAHFISNYGLIARFLPGKKVLSVWGSDILVVPRKSPIHSFLTGWILRGFSKIHVDAEFIKTLVAEKYGVDRERVWVFPFGLKKTDREIKIPREKARIFVSHRRLDPDMDPLTIVKAFSKLQQEDTRLLMMSTGILESRIREFIDETRIQGVELTGRVSRETIIQNLKKSKFYVSASLTDSTSVSLLEAMAAGCFPIVTDIEGNREWIINGKNGLLFEPGNVDELAGAMDFALKNRNLVDRAILENKKLVLEKANFERNLERFFGES